MAFSPGYKARLLLDDVSWSALLNDISLPRTIEMLDVTTFADNGVKRFIPGLDSSSITMSGFVDATATAAGSGWSESGPLTYAPVGLTTGSQTELISAHKTSFEVSTQVGAAAAFSLAGQTDGHTDLGVSLTDLQAFTTDTNGTAVDGGAASSGGGVAHLHVTAYSGFTDVNVTVEGSANGSTGWATVATFAQFTGTTSERVVVAGSVARYLRVVVDVDGTGSTTLHVSFARR